MKFIATPIAGVMVIEPQAFGDERGFFMETWHARPPGRHRHYLVGVLIECLRAHEINAAHRSPRFSPRASAAARSDAAAAT